MYCLSMAINKTVCQKYLMEKKFVKYIIWKKNTTKVARCYNKYIFL